MSALEIRAARPAEAAAVLAVLNDAAAWLIGRGVDQWTPGQWRSERIASAIDRGEIYVAARDGAILATVSLEWTDTLIWPEASDEAGYVHRLAVGTGAHGRNVGGELLRWAEVHIAENGRRFARLDCACDNSSLRAYHERAGYVHKGDRSVRGAVGPEYCGSRYEKPIIP